MLRSVDKWLVGYLRSICRRPDNVPGVKHLIVCVADHFEPFRAGASHETAVRRVRRWVDEYPSVVDDYTDAGGNHPKHTFFYPEEEYDPECLDLLADLTREGYGEVEMHLHHRNDTGEGFRTKLAGFRDVLHSRHGLLGKDLYGNLRYGFIHGNWALCNSRPDGDWCGVNEELGVLSDTGCYADFTFPSAPSPTQPRMVNAIYRARDFEGRPRGADRGDLVAAPIARGESYHYETRKTHEKAGIHCESSQINSRNLSNTPIRPYADTSFRSLSPELMLIQGPLGLNWKARKYGVLPRLENAEVSSANRPSAERLDLWIKQHIHVIGAPEWIFVKLHTHGCVEQNADVFLGGSKPTDTHRLTQIERDITTRRPPPGEPGALLPEGKDCINTSAAQKDLCNGLYAFRPSCEETNSLYALLDEKCGSGAYVLHYVTAREMYNLVRAAEDGKGGDPEEFRNYEILPPAGV